MANLLNFIEVTFIGITAIVTSISVIYIGRQTNRHFLMQRSTGFIERFNSGTLLQMRYSINQHLKQDINWDNELNCFHAGKADEAKTKLIYEFLMYTIFFQELGAAYKHKTVDADYTWSVFGYLVKKYWSELKPYIDASRIVNNRKTLFEDFQYLAQSMADIENKQI